MSDFDLDKLLEQENPAEVSRRTLVDLRRRIAAGEAVPEEEIADGIRKLRQMYGQEAQTKIQKAAAKKPAKKASAKKVDTDDLLKGILGGL